MLSLAESAAASETLQEDDECPTIEETTSDDGIMSRVVDTLSKVQPRSHSLYMLYCQC